MRVLPFSHFVSSMPNINEKVAEALTPQQKRIYLIAFAVFSCIVVAAYYVWKHFKGSVNTPAVENETSQLDLSKAAMEAQTKLEEGINISDDTLAKIKELMPKIRKREKDDAIEWITPSNNLVFKIAGVSNLIFKMARGGEGAATFRNGKWIKASNLMDERFATVVKGKQVCLANQLELLVIPHTKKIKIDGHTLIAEECLDFDRNKGVQERLYSQHSTQLNETARQLAIFIAKTGYNDVIWRNIPLLNEAKDFQGNRRVGLIDIEDMESAVEGFVGSENRSCGLIHCVSKDQIDLVIQEARKQGVVLSDEEANNAKKRRLEELETDKKLQAFHEKNGIVNGKELIQVDVETLGLDLTQEWVWKNDKDDDGRNKTITLRKVTEDVIAEINKYLQNSSDQASIKGKRNITLVTDRQPIRNYKYVGSGSISLSDEEKKKLWLPHILQALVDKGYLFKWTDYYGDYILQA